MNPEMSDTNQSLTSSESVDQTDNWFSHIFDRLRADHFMLKSNIAPKETKEFYDKLMSPDEGLLISKMRNDSAQYFIKKIVFDYLNELKSSDSRPLKLAMGLSESKILIWSEIEDNDESAENALLITEAKINGKYNPKGFFVNSTIIEKSDNLPIPPHYQSIID